MYNFCGSVACSGKVQFVLDDPVKKLGFFAVAVVVAAALLENVSYFLISAPLAGAYLAYFSSNSSK